VEIYKKSIFTKNYKKNNIFLAKININWRKKWEFTKTNCPKRYIFWKHLKKKYAWKKWEFTKIYKKKIWCENSIIYFARLFLRLWWVSWFCLFDHSKYYNFCISAQSKIQLLDTSGEITLQHYETFSLKLQKRDNLFVRPNLYFSNQAIMGTKKIKKSSKN